MQCLPKEEGSHFLALRMAASKRATGLPSSVAIINKGVYPGALHKSETTLWNEMCFSPVNREYPFPYNMLLV